MIIKSKQNLRMIIVVKIGTGIHQIWRGFFRTNVVIIMMRKYSSIEGVAFILNCFISLCDRIMSGAPIPPPLTEGPFNDMQGPHDATYLSVAYDGNHRITSDGSAVCCSKSIGAW